MPSPFWLLCASLVDAVRAGVRDERRHRSFRSRAGRIAVARRPSPSPSPTASPSPHTTQPRSESEHANDGAVSFALRSLALPLGGRSLWRRCAMRSATTSHFALSATCVFDVSASSSWCIRSPGPEGSLPAAPFGVLLYASIRERSTRADRERADCAAVRCPDASPGPDDADGPARIAAARARPRPPPVAGRRKLFAVGVPRRSIRAPRPVRRPRHDSLSADACPRRRKQSATTIGTLQDPLARSRP